MTILGIDLGTTNSLVAILGKEGPRLLPNALGEVLTPSVVGRSPSGEIVVGRLAEEMRAVDPQRTAALFKRWMGTDRTATLGGQKYQAPELSAMVLRSLCDDAEQALGEPVARAVISVPAYFNDERRQATKDAGRIAGLEVERILNEPTAAALAYGFHERAEEKTILVFDLGGGTFDVSILEVFEGVLEVRSSAGEAFLGGEDFTRNLMAEVLARAEIPASVLDGKPVLAAKFRNRCEAAKIALTSVEETEVPVPDFTASEWTVARTVVVTEKDLREVNRELIDKLARPTWRAIRDVGLRPEAIDEVILVGGATRMRGIVDFVRDFFGSSPRCSIDPDHVVALGAGVQGGLIDAHEAVEEIVVTDVTPFTLGCDVSKQFGRKITDGYFLPIIDRNTTIPVSRTETVVTIHPGQTEMEIKVYQGENRKVTDNHYLGKLCVKKIPPRPAGEEAVDLRYTYDIDGILEVEASVRSTGKSEALVIQHGPRRLSEKELKRALARMQAIKMHPREALPNKVLLARAERVYSEASGRERDELSALTDQFEGALESRDPQSISIGAANLENFIKLVESIIRMREAGGEEA